VILARQLRRHRFDHRRGFLRFTSILKLSRWLVAAVLLQSGARRSRRVLLLICGGRAFAFSCSEGGIFLRNRVASGWNAGFPLPRADVELFPLDFFDGCF